MSTQFLVVLCGSGLALISGLILLVINSMRTSINRLEEATSKRLDKQDAAIEKLKDALSELKESFRDRADGTRDIILSQIEDTEKQLNTFQNQVLSDNVTHGECRRSMEDLKARISKLENALKEVDLMSREQSLILARIEQAIRSL